MASLRPRDEMWWLIDSGLFSWGRDTRQEDVEESPTQSRISPSIHDEMWWCMSRRIDVPLTTEQPPGCGGVCREGLMCLRQIPWGEMT